MSQAMGGRDDGWLEHDARVSEAEALVRAECEPAPHPGEPRWPEAPVVIRTAQVPLDGSPEQLLIDANRVAAWSVVTRRWRNRRTVVMSSDQGLGGAGRTDLLRRRARAVQRGRQGIEPTRDALIEEAQVLRDGTWLSLPGRR